MGATEFQALKTFVESRDVAVRAASHLADGVQVWIEFSDEPTVAYTFAREKKKSVLREGAPKGDYDFKLTATPEAVRRVVEFQSDSIGEFGVHFFRLMASEDPAVRITAKVKMGLWGFTTHGYPQLLGAGGAAVVGYLASKGVSLSSIGRILDKLRR